MIRYIFALIILFITKLISAQSLIVGIPSADVAEKNHLEITHETQWSFMENSQKWNSFNFVCFGMGNGLELTSTINNINNEGSQNLAIGLGAKKVFPLISETDKYERKLVLGGNTLFSTPNKNFGIWTYGLISWRIPKTKTRFTAGASYGNSQTFGFTSKFENGKINYRPNNRTVFLGGLEQPVYKNVSLICDWYSGVHDLAAFIPALQIDIKHHIFILGYKFPNNPKSGNQALILEFMINIPTRK
jgi:hypothetical protein